MIKLLKFILKRVFSLTGIFIAGCIFLGTLCYINSTAERNYYPARVEITNIYKQAGIHNNKYRITFKHKNTLNTFTGNTYLGRKLKENNSYNVIVEEIIWSKDSIVYVIDKVLD